MKANTESIYAKGIANCASIVFHEGEAENVIESYFNTQHGEYVVTCTIQYDYAYSVLSMELLTVDGGELIELNEDDEFLIVQKINTN